MTQFLSMLGLMLLMTFVSLGCGTPVDRHAGDQTRYQNALAGSGPQAADIPSNLRVNGSPIATVHATGVQIYTLVTGPDGTPMWKLKAPDATFTGPGIAGKHYAGPTWECTTDGSKVVGRMLAEHPSPAPQAVGWLLLQAKTHAGTGVLSSVTFIQRIHTAGGKPPSTQGAKEGDEVRVPYQADYVLYGPGATTQP